MSALSLNRYARSLDNSQKSGRDTLFSGFKRLFSNRSGRVDLVGAGPGDPELLTRKAWRLMLEADVIVYDALVSPAMLAELPDSIRLIYVGKRAGQHSSSQAEICTLIVHLAKQGHKVVRLKGGDPLVFGRLGEELDALLAADIPYSVVPGITSASGTAANLGFSLTEREIAPRLRLVTAQFSRERTHDWQELAQSGETLVFYMGLSKVAEISAGLLGAGLPGDHPVLLVENGTLPEQRTVKTSLAQMAQAVNQHQLKAPTLIYIGEVVNQRPLLTGNTLAVAR